MDADEVTALVVRGHERPEGLLDLLDGRAPDGDQARPHERWVGRDDQEPALREVVGLDGIEVERAGQIRVRVKQADEARQLHGLLVGGCGREPRGELGELRRPLGLRVVDERIRVTGADLVGRSGRGRPPRGW